MKLIYFMIAVFFYHTLLVGDAFGQRWVQHTNAQGIASDEQIHQILEDHYGNIWLATSTGIKKASEEHQSFKLGKFWESYSKSNNDNLINDLVKALAVDLNGHLWIGTYGGLSRTELLTDLRDPKNWHNYTVANTDSGLSHNFIEAIAIDSSGNIWFGTIGGGISIALRKMNLLNPQEDPYYDPNNWIHEPVFLNSVNDIAIDDNGFIWVATQFSTIRYSGVDSSGVKGRTVINEVQNTSCIFIDSKGYIWLGTFGDGVWRVHEDSLDSFQHFPKIGGKDPFRYIGAIAEDADGFIWFGRAETNEIDILSIIDPRKDLNDPDNWADYGVDDGLSGGNIQAILKDSYGNMWIGTKESGLTQYNDTWLKFNIKAATELSNNTILALTIDTGDNLWIGTENGYLCKLYLRDNLFIKNNWRYYPNPIKYLYGREIRALYQDSKGYLWIGIQTGLCRIDLDANLELFDNWSDLDTLSNVMVRTIIEDTQGYIWLGTDNGLWRTHQDSLNNLKDIWCEQFDTSNGLAHQVVNSILQSKSGDIWIATNDGLNKIDPNTNLTNRNNWKKFTKEDGLADNFIDVVFQDSTGNLWFGTHCGISKINPADSLRDRNNWETITSLDGLPSDAIMSIIQPNKNEIWVGTLGGLGKFDLISNRGWTAYTVGDGLGSNIILSLVADNSKGDVWIGTESGGVTRYRMKTRPPETLLINSFDIVFQDRIIFEYTGIDLTTPTYDLLYSYSFDDDSTWSEFCSATSASLILPRSDRPTYHIFKVKAMDKDGNIDPTPATDIFWKMNEQMGGWLSFGFNDDTIRIYIPPNESEARDLLINQLQPYQLPDAASTIFAFSIKTAFGDSLKKPATMQVKLNGWGEVNKSELAIFRLNANSDWNYIGGTVELLSDNILLITTTFKEFATYAVRKPLPSAAIHLPNRIDIQPRVFSPSGGGQGHGDHSTVSFTLKYRSPVNIKIYNLAGRLKKILKENVSFPPGINAVEWDGRDDDGEICASGLYIITLETEEDVRTKTVMISNKYSQGK